MPSSEPAPPSQSGESGRSGQSGRAGGGGPEARELLSGPVLEVAPALLGAVLRHDGVAVRLTEVEAYAGAADPGSHAYRGRTSRNATMFGAPGLLYVYFVYGMHHCANVVTGPVDEPSAVLLRAGEIVEGRPVAQRRRGPGVAHRDLARGPARLCVALGIDRQQNGVDLLSGPVRLELPQGVPARARRGPRVGVRQGADLPWRFWIEGDPTTSPYRSAAPRRRARRTAGDL